MSADRSGREGSHGVDVAVVISQLAAGGAQRVVVNLVGAWVESGRRVAVLTFDDGTRDFFRLHDGVRRVALDLEGDSASPVRAVMANVRRVLELRRALRAMRPEVVLAFTGVTNVLTVLATRGLGIRVVISERNDPAKQRLGSPWDLLRRLTYGRADRVTAINADALQAMASYVPTERLAVVPIPLARPVGGPAVELAGPYVLQVGRFHLQKAHDVTLRAFAAVAADHPAWHLALVGDGLLRPELERLAADLGIAARVIWAGEVDDPAPWYRGAAVFAYPSRYEGVGNALLEAMSHGLPVVVSDGSPGPLHHVVHGESGLVVPVEDDRALATALGRLMADPELRLRLGAGAAREAATLSSDAALPVWEPILWPD